jgi:hypothetical protein
LINSKLIYFVFQELISSKRSSSAREHKTTSQPSNRLRMRKSRISSVPNTRKLLARISQFPTRLPRLIERDKRKFSAYRMGIFLTKGFGGERAQVHLLCFMPDDIRGMGFGTGYVL